MGIRAMEKRVLAFLISASVCAYALVQKMQAVAIVALVASLAVIFKHQAAQIYKSGLDLIQSTKQAKLGSLEVHLSRELENLPDRLMRQAAWIQMLLSQLDSEQIGLLLSISKVDKYPATGALKDRLRSLRARGLIHHNEATMEAATEVWLTELGRDLAGALLAAIPEESGEDGASAGKGAQTS
jgi:hypothetical protein